MIETLDIDISKFAYGFITSNINSEDCKILDKTCRASFYQMFWVKRGEIIIHIDSETTSIVDNQCAFIDINQIYRIETPSYFEVLTVQFTQNFYCRHDIDINFLESCVFFGNPHTILKFTLHTSLKKILEQYYLSLQHICRQPYNELLCHFAHNTVERLLLFSQKELLDSVYAPAATEKTDQDIGNHFRQLIKQNSKDVKLVNYYAGKLNVSVKKLTQICNKMYGLSPKKMIMEQTVIEAKRLLQYSSLNIKEIAYELKFQEPSNFIRFFAHSVGMSPKEFRDNFKPKQSNY